VKPIVLYGRGAYPGVAEGFAVVCPDSIAGNTGGLGDTDGVIYEAGSSARGQCIAGKILVLPGAKGSNGFSAHFKAAAISGFAPAGWIVTRMDSRIGGAIVSLRTPAVTDFADADPLSVLETGDYIRVDGTNGVVTVWKKAPGTGRRNITAKESGICPGRRNC